MYLIQLGQSGGEAVRTYEIGVSIVTVLSPSCQLTLYTTEAFCTPHVRPQWSIDL